MRVEFETSLPALPGGAVPRMIDDAIQSRRSRGALANNIIAETSGDIRRDKVEASQTKRCSLNWIWDCHWQVRDLPRNSMLPICQQNGQPSRLQGAPAAPAHLTWRYRAGGRVTWRPLHNRRTVKARATARQVPSTTLRKKVQKGSRRQMLASAPASILDHNPPSLGILRFAQDSKRSSESKSR